MSPEGACGTQGVSPRPRRHVGEHMAPHAFRHMAPCAFGRAHGKGCVKQPPRRQANACVPHATVLSACYSQRPHVLGALTECLHRHIAGSLGRPPRLRVIVLSLLCVSAPHGTPPHERPANATGPSHPAPAPMMKPAHLFGRSGMGNQYSWTGAASSEFRKKRNGCAKPV